MTILKSVRHLDSCGVLGGNTLVTIMFQGEAKAPPILSAEVPRVTHADLFVDYDASTKRPNRGGIIIKGGMKIHRPIWLGRVWLGIRS